MPLVPSTASDQTAPGHRPQRWKVSSSLAMPRRSTGTPEALSEAEGSMPIEPVSIDAASERMSPNMLPVTITSN